MEDRIRELIEKAFDMRNYSYAPYSHFKVGAALLSKKGTIYGGCNIENAAYGPSNCAERTAFFKAVSEGEGPEAGVTDYCSPCGVCRQVMAEFCRPEEFKIILAKSIDDHRIYTLKELFPLGFSPESLG